MSSINPVFLLPDTEKSEMEQIAEGLFTSATLGVGQFCTNPGVVFYPDSVAGEFFRNAFVEKMKAFAPAPMLHKGIRDSYLENFEMMAKLEGVEVLCGSENVLGPKTCHAGSTVLATEVFNFLQVPELKNEIFGPATMLVSYKNDDDLEKVITQLEGQLTASLFGSEKSLSVHRGLVEILETKAGRLLFNQFPTGVEVCESIVHGGPYPATTDSRSTSVGTGAILRFARPVCYQGFPDDFLPEELRRDNPLGLDRKEV
jgi:NADP-dependent aldehyde dehydrogenase